MSQQIGDGLHIHLTAKGKFVWVARKDGEPITFQPTIQQVRKVRNQMNRTISEFEKMKESDNDS